MRVCLNRSVFLLFSLSCKLSPFLLHEHVLSLFVSKLCILSLHPLYTFYVSCFVFSHFNSLPPASRSLLLHFNCDFHGLSTSFSFNLHKMSLRFQFAGQGTLSSAGANAVVYLPCALQSPAIYSPLIACQLSRAAKNRRCLGATAIDMRLVERVLIVKHRRAAGRILQP